MIVNVSGTTDTNIVGELQKAAHFYAKELLSHQMRPHIEINIELTPKIKDLGYCTVAFLNDWNRARYFDIEIKKSKSLEKMLKVLAHEMVHLKQFAKGQLSEDHNRWYGFYIDSDTIEYSNQPWEIEAASLETVLYIMYREEHPINK